MIDQRKYIVDRSHYDGWVRAWYQGRSIIVQVWIGDFSNAKKTPTTEPDGDWDMGAALTMEGAVDQAVYQTSVDLKHFPPLGKPPI
jgi:hypothetical protein